jgi:hypothetical protein
MPYRLKKVVGGYKVCLVRDPNRTFSKEPMSHMMAERQMKAIEASEHDKTGGAGEGKTGVFGLSDYAKSPNFKSLSFQKQLLSLGINPDDYLTTVKHLAAKYRYDPDKIDFATDGKHKIKYASEKGPVLFGAVGYGDFIIWKYLEKYGKVTKGIADTKRGVFVKSHKAMVKDYGVTDLSPNTLAIRVLWDAN